MALSPDGRRMAIVNFSGLRLVDFLTLKPEWTVALPGWWGRPVEVLVRWPARRRARAEHSRDLRGRDGRRRHHDDSTPVGRVGAVAWSPSGDRIVTGNTDGFVRVWDAATGKLIWHKLLAPIVTVGGQAAAPDVRRLHPRRQAAGAAGTRDHPSNSGKGIVMVYDAATGEVARDPSRLAPTRGAVTRWPDGRRRLRQSHRRDRGRDGPAALEHRNREQAGHLRATGRFQFEANPISFHAALKDGNVIRYNVLTGHEQRRFFADGRTPEQRKAAGPRDSVLSSAAFSADGRTMASFSRGWISLWDVEAGALRRRIGYPGADECLLALAPDGKTVAATDVRTDKAFGESVIRVYNVETGEPVLTLEPGDDRADVMAFSPDGTRLLTGSERGSAIVWDVHRGQRPPAGRSAKRSTTPATRC